VKKSEEGILSANTSSFKNQNKTEGQEDGPAFLRGKRAEPWENWKKPKRKTEKRRRRNDTRFLISETNSL